VSRAAGGAARAAVWPPLVVMVYALPEHSFEVAPTKDERPVQALPPDVSTQRSARALVVEAWGEDRGAAVGGEDRWVPDIRSHQATCAYAWASPPTSPPTVGRRPPSDAGGQVRSPSRQSCVSSKPWPPRARRTAAAPTSPAPHGGPAGTLPTLQNPSSARRAWRRWAARACLSWSARGCGRGALPPGQRHPPNRERSSRRRTVAEAAPSSPATSSSVHAWVTTRSTR
jgi:hypothetical protein